MNDRAVHHGTATVRHHTSAGGKPHGHHEHDAHDVGKAEAGHQQTGHGNHVGQFRPLFRIMLVLAIPVVGLHEMFAQLVGYPLPGAGQVGGSPRFWARSCSSGAVGPS